MIQSQISGAFRHFDAHEPHYSDTCPHQGSSRFELHAYHSPKLPSNNLLLSQNPRLSAMSRARIPFNWRPPFRSRPPALHLRSSIRPQSTEASGISRLDRLTSRLPKRLQKYTNGLRNAPVSHVVSFMILHELTAIVPLFGLFALFHYTTYVPISYMTEHFGEYVQGGVYRFEKYFKRKGWFGFGQEDSSTSPQLTPGTTSQDAHVEDAIQRWEKGEQKYKILVEVALAYAITKALLPVRIIGSVWATPWFANILVRIKSSLARRP